MKAISQVVVAVMLVGVALVAGILLAHMASGLVTTYSPKNLMLARIGTVSAEVAKANQSGYVLVVSAKIANMGTKQYTVSSGSIIVMLKGAGKAKLTTCPLTSEVTIRPGEVKDVRGRCFISTSEMQDLYGAPTPPFDDVKSSVTYLYIRITVSQPSEGGSGGGSGGGGSSGGSIGGGGGGGEFYLV